MFLLFQNFTTWGLQVVSSRVSSSVVDPWGLGKSYSSPDLQGPVSSENKADDKWQFMTESWKSHSFSFQLYYLKHPEAYSNSTEDEAGRVQRCHLWWVKYLVPCLENLSISQLAKKQVGGWKEKLGMRYTEFCPKIDLPSANKIKIVKLSLHYTY